MDSTPEIGHSLQYSNPIYKRIAEIRSMFEINGHIIGPNRNTLKRRYFDYEIDQNRQGHKVTLNDFYNSLITEIEGYRNSLINLEEKIGANFYPVFIELQKCKELIEGQRTNFDARYINAQINVVNQDAENSNLNVKNINQHGKEFVTFGYKGDIQKLKNCLTAIDNKIELVDQLKCRINDLVEVLTSKKISEIDKVVYLSCETAQFAFIVTVISKFFKGSLKKNIEISGKFFSKNGTQIKANSLYVAKRKTPNPKLVDELNEIFKVHSL